MLSKIFHTINFCDPLKRFTQIDRIIECCCCCLCCRCPRRAVLEPGPGRMKNVIPSRTRLQPGPKPQAPVRHSSICWYSCTHRIPASVSSIWRWFRPVCCTHKVSQFACAKLSCCRGRLGAGCHWAWPIKCMYIIINSHSLSD